MIVLKQYLPLCWFANQPLELPRAVSFFKQNLIVYFIVEYFLQANLTDDLLESFIEVTLEILVTLAFTGLILPINKTLYAYVQVTTALLFCANVISLLAIPVIVWASLSKDPLSYYVLSLLFLWYFALVSYIIKEAVAINILASTILSFVYLSINYLGAFGIAQLV